jgi:hypothetical protein
MPGLAPGIHVLLCRSLKDVDGRNRPGHDESCVWGVPVLRSGMKNAASRPGHEKAYFFFLAAFL